ncbi:hypothetical protein CDV36_001244 [Fusarium kuroshium]|uniref:Uncharacterized protein n=1 Tax=Fusarium kuroshium TaxID=2010991 RepID=A0A3M2SNI1_9HYPO|nr:hypothetical protein CDV36_001244 [Fusarium kuroshium]
MSLPDNTGNTRASQLQVLPKDLSPARKQAQRDLIAISRRLPVDPLGVHCLGRDGVMRSVTANRQVLGAVPLEPRLIKASLDILDYDEELEAEFRGVDGTKAPKEHWFEPPPGILPPPLSKEQLEEARKFTEENGMNFDIVPGIEAGVEVTGDERMCPVVVRSDHNILPRDGKAKDNPSSIEQ